MKGFRRFYRVRALSALLLCLPGLCLTLWYAWNAYASFDRYRRSAGEDVALSLEDFHLQLFDLLRRDLRRMVMPGVPEKSKVPHLSVHLSPDELGTLLRGADKESKRPYAKATLTRGAEIQELEMRVRGRQHWHLMGEKKSYKFKLPKGDLFDGHRVFNLVNDPMPMKVGEQLILDLTREQGVLAPESSFARLELNGKDLGLYHFLAQVDEGVLRKNRRMPGSMYSGNLPSSAKTEELWRDAARWKKVAWRNMKEKDSKADLERLLRMIDGSSLGDFVDFARREIDLEAFAAFDAMDVLFGGDQHNFRENHKFFFDPYKGRWAPVAWSFRAFRHDPWFNLVENPLLLRLKTVPEYLTLRNRMIYRMLTHEASPSALRERTLELLRRLSAELAADPYWAAYKLLPRTDAFRRRMMRPMDLRRLALVIESELETYSRRHAYLLGELRGNPLYLDLSVEEKSGRLIVFGRSAVRVEALSPRWTEQCAKPWRAFVDERAVTEESLGAEASLVTPLDLYPGLRMIAREDADPRRGSVRAIAAPAAYALKIEGGCELAELSVSATHLATGARMYSRPAPAEVLNQGKEATLGRDGRPLFRAGEVVVHPSKLRSPEAKVVELGPGEVRVDATRIFAEQETVRIAPGTRLVLGPEVSLIFYGRLLIDGESDRPVNIVAAGERPWGGIALQGPETAGSRLRHLRAYGGRRVVGHGAVYPGMLNIHDTSDIQLADCRFGRNMDSDDVVHAAYVRELEVRDTWIEEAARDAFDLEFVDGKLTRIQVVRAGDEAVDLMDSRLELSDSVLLACGGNAVSAGEESRVRVQDVLIADSKVGVLAKNASRVELAESLLYRNKIGLRIYKRTIRYQGDSQIAANAVFVVKSEEDVKTDKGSRGARVGGLLQNHVPRRGVLQHLMDNVLGLSAVEALDDWIAERMKK